MSSNWRNPDLFRRPNRLPLLWTPAALAVAFVLQVANLYAAARILGTSEFSTYVYAMRIAVWATILGGLGLDWAVARSASMGGADGARTSLRNLALASSVAWALAILGGWLGRGFLSQALFGDGDHGALVVLSIAAGVGGTAITAAAQARRGLGHVGRANLLHLSYYAVVAALLLGLYVQAATLPAGLATAVLVAAPAIVLMVVATVDIALLWRLPGTQPLAPRAVREDLTFGLQRAGGQLLLATVFLLPLAISARLGAGALAVSAVVVSLFRLVEPLGQGLALVVFPAAARAQGQSDGLARGTVASVVTSLALTGGAVLAPFLAIMAGPVALAWFGIALSDGAALRLAMAGAGAYATLLVLQAATSGSSRPGVSLVTSATSLVVALVVAAVASWRTIPLPAESALAVGLLAGAATALALWLRNDETGMARRTFRREAAAAAAAFATGTAFVMFLAPQTLLGRLGLAFLSLAAAAGALVLLTEDRAPIWVRALFRMPLQTLAHDSEAGPGPQGTVWAWRIFGLALGLRLAATALIDVFWRRGVWFHPDSQFFLDGASRLAMAWEDHQTTPAAGFSRLLAVLDQLTGHPQLAGMLVVILAVSAAAGLATATLTRAGLPRAGLIAGLLLALDPGSVYFGTQLLRDPIFILATVLVSMPFLGRPGAPEILGALGGLWLFVSLNRPDMGLVLVALLVAARIAHLATARLRLLRVPIAASGALLGVVSTWLLRDRIEALRPLELPPGHVDFFSEIVLRWDLPGFLGWGLQLVLGLGTVLAAPPPWMATTPIEILFSLTGAWNMAMLGLVWASLCHHRLIGRAHGASWTLMVAAVGMLALLSLTVPTVAPLVRYRIPPWTILAMAAAIQLDPWVPTLTRETRRIWRRIALAPA